MTPADFTDGSANYPGCKCGFDCPYPCWQRRGTAPACDDCGCAAFPEHARADPHDRAEELGNMPDLWPEIERWTTIAIGDALNAVIHTPFDDNGLEAKFRKGEVEHGRNWLGMTREQLEREITQEVQDLRLYFSMLRARFGAGYVPPAE